MYRAVSLLCLFPVLICLAAAQANAWPHLRGPDQLSAHLPEVDLQPWSEAKVRWSAEVGVGCTTFAIADGKAVTIGNRDDVDTVYCFELGSGEVLWQFSYPEPTAANFYKGGPNMTPVIDADRLYWTSRNGEAFCLSLADGAVVWREQVAGREALNPPRWGFSGAPLILEDRLIVNMGDAGTALAKADGATIWTSRGGGAGYAGPVLRRLPTGDRVLIFTGRSLVQVDPADGSVDWQHGWTTDYDVNAATPLPTAHGILVGSGYDSGTGLLSADGSKRLWYHDDMQHHMNAGVVIGEYVYGVNSWHNGSKGKSIGGHLYCMEIASGTVRWQTPGYGCGTVIGLGDKLLVLSEDGRLQLVTARPDSFQLLSEAQVLSSRCWNLPAYSDGLVLIKNDLGSCRAIELRP